MKQFRIEPDSAGRDVVHHTAEKPINDATSSGRYYLNTSFICYDHTTGRARKSSEGGAPVNLTEIEVEMLRWYSEKHPPAEAWVFAGEPPNG